MEKNFIDLETSFFLLYVTLFFDRVVVSVSPLVCWGNFSPGKKGPISVYDCTGCFGDRLGSCCKVFSVAWDIDDIRIDPRDTFLCVSPGIAF